MARLVLLLILFLIIGRLFWRLMDGVIEGITGQPRSRRTQTPSVPMVRDPVCGTFVLPDRSVSLAEGRNAIYFCSEACRDRYRARSA
jgi:YHS domain-containing protein